MTFSIGDIVKHNKNQSRLGIVVGIDNNTILVEWFDREGGFAPYRYFPFALIKVSR